jgi:hypothetical protein
MSNYSDDVYRVEELTEDHFESAAGSGDGISLRMPTATAARIKKARSLIRANKCSSIRRCGFHVPDVSEKVSQYYQ